MAFLSDNYQADAIEAFNYNLRNRGSYLSAHVLLNLLSHLYTK